MRDYSELVAPLVAELPPELPPKLPEGAWPAPFAWDDPCHLCHGQGIRAQPRRILDAIPGMRRVEMQGSESCCGSAGIYSLLRPATAAEVLDPKIRALVECGAKTLVTANPGCQMQWEAGLARAGVDVRVAHIAEVLGGSLEVV